MAPARAWLGSLLLVSAIALGGEARADGAAEASRPGFLGVRLERVPTGLRVVAVPSGSPAASAGILAGDVIVRARGIPPGSPDGFTTSVRAAGAGASYPLVLQRGRQRVELSVQLAAIPESGVHVGSPAPPLSAQVVMGNGPAELSQLRGRVVLLDFWASWCGPCRLLMPALDRLHQRYAAQGLTVLGVTDDDAATARAVGGRMGLGYTIATDPLAANRFGVRGLPTTILIDRQGRVRRVGVGVDGDEIRQLDQTVRRLVDESPAAP